MRRPLTAVEQTAALLAPFFPRGLGDASEPALPTPPRPTPAAAAPRELVVA